jgi:formate hydrogenlyase subunit 3/multisubunit Na+/H+ antiporter MnhD subunit
MIPVPLLLVATPLIVAGILYLIRRITVVATVLGAAGSLLLAWLAYAAPLAADQTILDGRVVGGVHVVLGRPIALSAADRPILIVLGLTTAILIVLAARLRPGDVFFPGILGLLGIVAAVLVNETFVFSVLLMEVAAALVTFLLQGSRFGSSRGAWRFFIFATLAMPFLLVAGWQIDFQAANPGQIELLNPAVLLLTLGFLIYLGAVPFHFWIGPTATETEPLVQVVALSFYQVAGLTVIVGAFDQFPWFAASQTPYQWFSFAGTLTVGLGVALAFGARSFGRLGGYILLVDMGTVLLLLGLKNRGGLEAAWAVALLRAASLTIWAAGLTPIRERAGSDEIRAATGLGWQARLAAAVTVLGGLSLAGFPLTPGFAGRWTAANLIAGESLGRGVLLLMGSASGVIGVLRMATVLLTQRDGVDAEAERGERRAWLTGIALAAVAAGAVALSLAPAPLLRVAKQITQSFTYLP